MNALLAMMLLLDAKVEVHQLPPNTAFWLLLTLDVKMLATNSPTNTPMDIETHVGSRDSGFVDFGCMSAKICQTCADRREGAEI